MNGLEIEHKKFEFSIKKTTNILIFTFKMTRSNRSAAGKINYAKRRRTEDNDERNNALNESMEHFDLNNDIGAATPPRFADACCQTDDNQSCTKTSQTDQTGNCVYFSEIHENIEMHNIGDFFCDLADIIPNYGAIHSRVLSTSVYILLR